MVLVVVPVVAVLILQTPETARLGKVTMVEQLQILRPTMDMAAVAGLVLSVVMEREQRVARAEPD
jgi:hypothetical protein